MTDSASLNSVKSYCENFYGWQRVEKIAQFPSQNCNTVICKKGELSFYFLHFGRTLQYHLLK